jgi:hypothetical protein
MKKSTPILIKNQNVKKSQKIKKHYDKTKSAEKTSRKLPPFLILTVAKNKKI